jgi:hypothetical protein
MNTALAIFGVLVITAANPAIGISIIGLIALGMFSPAALAMVLLLAIGVFIHSFVRG